MNQSGFREVAAYPWPVVVAGYPHAIVASDTRQKVRKERLSSDGTRYEKTFQWRQRRNGRWELGRGDEPIGLFLQEEIEAAPIGKVITVHEGEKAALAARAHGLLATCLPDGSSPTAMKDHHVELLRGRRVAIFADNDEVGRAHAQRVAERLYGIAEIVKVIELPDQPPKGDYHDWAQKHTLKQTLHIMRETPEWTPASAPSRDVWDEPSPLHALGSRPAFPTHTLPHQYAAFVDAVAEYTQTPTDLSGCLALGLLSAAAAGRVAVSAPWWEPLIAWIVVALPPANLKSAVFRHFLAPLFAFERGKADELRPLIEHKATERRIAEIRAQKAERDAGEGKHDATDDAAIECRRDANRIEVPVSPRVVADDHSPEALTSLIADHGGRMTVASAEGGAFDIMAGRYTRVPNLDVYLKGHAGDTLLVDRKNRPPEHIPSTALTLILTVQDEVIRSAYHQPGFRGKGLLARPWYSVPRTLIGRRNVRDPRPIPREVEESYTTAVKDLIGHSYDLPELVTIPFSDDALAEMVAFREQLEAKLGPGGVLHHIGDWAGKLHGAVARIAGLLHLADHGPTGLTLPIPGSTVARAVEVAHYLTAHALVAFDLMGATPDLEDAREMLRWVERKVGADDITEFSRRDAHNENRARFPKATDTDAPLALLEAHTYIRRIDAESGPKGGRPSVRYQINPKFIETIKNPAPDSQMTSQNPQYTQYPVVERGFAGSAGFAGPQEGVEDRPTPAEQNGQTAAASGAFL